MWPPDDEDDGNWVWHVWDWNIRSEHVPILVGIVTSATLILLLASIYILWRCCIPAQKKNDPGVVDLETVERKISPTIPSYSAVFLDPKSASFVYNSRVIELIPEQEGVPYWLYKNHYLQTMPIDDTDHQPHSFDTIESLKRSQRPSSQHFAPSPVASVENCSLPQISEFCAHPCQYASSSILDDCYSWNANNLSNVKTRSLPSCVRLKKRPLSTIDNPSEFYDKVNFSKKRKNRMRNDEAAIIALSKSRSQFLNKDTDTLVDNEAVIVYDERTAL